MSDRAKCEHEACADADDDSPLAAIRWACGQAQARPDLAEFADEDTDREIRRREKAALDRLKMTASQVTRQGCGLDPATRVLTADLRWIAIGGVEVGQELVACDEHPHWGPARANGCRKMQTAVVEGVWRTSGPAYRITGYDGRVVICSAVHRWLSRKTQRAGHWRSIGGSGRYRDGRDKVRPGDLVRAIALPWGAPDTQDAWFGGIIDGEGSFIYRRCSGTRLRAYQCDGPVLQRMLGHCMARRYDHDVVTSGPRNTTFGRRPVHAITMSAMSTVFRALGLSRPVRFIGVRWWEGRRMPSNGWGAITAIEPAGEMELVAIQTSTRTCIAEGFALHDSTLPNPHGNGRRAQRAHHDG